MTIVRKFETTEENKGWRTKKISLLIFGCLIVLSVVEIWASNTLVNLGDKLAGVSNLQEVLEKENRILENNIAQNASLINIASESATLGLSKPKKVEYLP